MDEGGREESGEKKDGEEEGWGTEQVNWRGRRNNDGDRGPVRCMASTTMFPMSSRTTPTSQHNKSIVAKHVEASVMNDRTPGRQSQPSDSLPDSLPRSVAGDVTTCPRPHSLEPSHTHPCSNASPKKTSVTSSFPTFPRGMETTPAASPRSFKECSTRPTTRN